VQWVAAWCCMQGGNLDEGLGLGFSSESSTPLKGAASSQRAPCHSEGSCFAGGAIPPNRCFLTSRDAVQWMLMGQKDSPCGWHGKASALRRPEHFAGCPFCVAWHRPAHRAPRRPMHFGDALTCDRKSSRASVKGTGFFCARRTDMQGVHQCCAL